jgi:ATP/maltotriose-dependent transcriptional regulator MalT
VANELTDKKTGSLADVSVELDKLAGLLDKAITIMEDTRKRALDNHSYFQTMMSTSHEENETVSEDGILEKATNESMKHLIEASKILEKPIDALTKILAVKIQSEALMNAGVNKPIDIDSFRSP